MPATMSSVLGLLEQLGEGDRPHLEPFLDLGAGPAGLGGLGQSGLTLLGREGRRLRHGGHPSPRPSPGPVNDRDHESASGSISPSAATRVFDDREGIEEYRDAASELP